jgi:HEPN domain-containing protein
MKFEEKYSTEKECEEYLKFVEDILGKVKKIVSKK